MQYFDFHHHKEGNRGIYNLRLMQNPPKEQFYSVGIHPKMISEKWREELEWVKIMAKRKNCLALGECGLDAFAQTEDKKQEEIFLEQIFLANYLRKPLIVHCVRRFSILMKCKKLVKVPVMLHGFNKKGNLYKRFIEI